MAQKRPRGPDREYGQFMRVRVPDPEIDWGEVMKDAIVLYPEGAYNQMQQILENQAEYNEYARNKPWESNPVNSRWRGKGLLEYAVDYDREDLFKLILSYIYIDPKTILQYTADLKKAKYLKLLLANKDEKFLIPDSGLQPGPKIDVNFFYEDDTYGFFPITALCCAAKTDDSTCLQLLLKEPNIDLNLADGYYTPLYAAMYQAEKHKAAMHKAKTHDEAMEKAEMHKRVEENVNILVNDDRLYKQTPLSRGKTSLLVAAQVKSQNHPNPEFNKGFIVCQKIISRLLYNSKHTKAQLALNIIDMDGNSILSGACNISDLKLFKYFLYANGWGTHEKDTNPEKLQPELDRKISPNNAENWEKLNGFPFLNFLKMNDALGSSFYVSDFLMQNSFPDIRIYDGNVPIIVRRFIFENIMEYYARDTNRDMFLNILASQKINEFVESDNLDDIQKCMVELLTKIREFYNIK